MWSLNKTCIVLGVSCLVKRAARVTRHDSRFTAILLVGLLLTGCGFKPMYGKTESAGASAALLSGIAVDPVDTTDRRMAQLLREELEDRLNPSGAAPAHPAYRLKVSLTLSESAIGVAPDGTISRYNVYLNSTFTLLRNADGQAMTSGSLSDVGSYNNVTNAYYSTYVAKEDAIRRGMAEMAEMYRARLASYLSQNGGNPPVVTGPAPATPLQNVIQVPQNGQSL